jgi:hypothetical protein
MKYKLTLIALLLVLQTHAQRTTISLNGDWDFARTEKASPPKKFKRTIPVPGLIHLAKPKIEDYDIWFKMPEAVVEKSTHSALDIDYIPKYNWYKKEVLMDVKHQNSKVLLRIKKSQYVTQVYVNGIDMGTSLECYTPIEIPITRALKFGEENEILVKVGDRYWLPPQAAGSTDKEKEHYLPGIWDDVELIIGGDFQINNTLFLPDAKNAAVKAKVRVKVRGKERRQKKRRRTH